MTWKFLFRESKIMQLLIFFNLSLLCNPQFAAIVILNCLDYGLIRVFTPQCLTAGHCHDMSNGDDNSLHIGSSVYCSLRLQKAPCFGRVYRFFKIECSCHSITWVSCCLYSWFFPCWEMENGLTWVRNSWWIADPGHGRTKKFFSMYRDNEVLCMLCVVWLTSLVFKKHLLCILKQ